MNAATIPDRVVDAIDAEQRRLHRVVMLAGVLLVLSLVASIAEPGVLGLAVVIVVLCAFRVVPGWRTVRRCRSLSTWRDAEVRIWVTGAWWGRRANAEVMGDEARWTSSVTTCAGTPPATSGAISGALVGMSSAGAPAAVCSFSGRLYSLARVRCVQPEGQTWALLSERHGWPPTGNARDVLASMADLLLEHGIGYDGLERKVSAANAFWRSDESIVPVEFARWREELWGEVDRRAPGRERMRMIRATLCVLGLPPDEELQDTVDFFCSVVDDDHWGG